MDLEFKGENFLLLGLDKLMGTCAMRSVKYDRVSVEVYTLFLAPGA